MDNTASNWVFATDLVDTHPEIYDSLLYAEGEASMLYVPGYWKFEQVDGVWTAKKFGPCAPKEWPSRWVFAEGSWRVAN